jgi:cytochrome c oxidase subunit 2
VCVASTKPIGPRHIEITAKRFSFEPAEITVKKGETIEIVLTSTDVPHGVKVRELNLDLRARKGKSVSATISPQITGVFVGHCSVFCGSGHGQMTLTIRVVG